MPASGAPLPGELEELLALLAKIEADLKELQEIIAPLIERLGMNLQAWAYELGDGYRAEADALYRQLDAAARPAANPGGAYTYQQLADLDAAGRLARKGERAEAIGRVLGTAATALKVSLQMYARHAKNKQIVALVDQEKERLPRMRSLLETGNEQVQSCLELEKRIFLEYAFRWPAGRNHRKELDRRLDETVESMRQLTALQARLEYCRQVYQAIDEFQSRTPQQVEESKQRLVEVAVGSLEASQVRGTVYFLDGLDRQIRLLTWQAPYYQNGLPVGVGYFLRRGARRLPPKARLSAVDGHLERLRAENPTLRRPLDFLRAVRRAHIETGSAALVFGWHIGRVYAGLLIVSLAAVILLLSVTGLGGAISTGRLTAFTPGQVVALIFFLLLFGIAGGLAWLLLRER